MDSEELQDTMIEKINELNKRIELFSQLPTKTSGGDITQESKDEGDAMPHQGSGDNEEVVIPGADMENVNTTTSTSVFASTSVVIDTTAVSTNSIVSNTSIPTPMSVPLLDSIIFSTTSLLIQSVPSYSVSASSSFRNYTYSSPLIVRVTSMNPYESPNHSLPLPPLSTLNLGTGTSLSLARVPTMPPWANPSSPGITPTATTA